MLPVRARRPTLQFLRICQITPPAWQLSARTKEKAPTFWRSHENPRGSARPCGEGGNTPGRAA